MNKPGPLQYIAYAYGKRLPDSMREWVAHDLADHGAVRRHMIRYGDTATSWFSRRSGCCRHRCTCIWR